MSTQVRVTKERVSEGPGSSVRTTTYETKSSYDTDISYRPSMSQRNVVVNRTAYAGPNSKSMSMRSSYGGAFNSGLPSGSYGVVANTGMRDVVDSRQKEKKDMQDLNERFASYIEKVRFLEAQNRKLADELEKLKAKWGKETSAIKAMYQAELDEARRLLDAAEKAKAEYQIKCDSLEEVFNELKEKLADTIADRDKHREAFENQCRTITDLESEIELLRKRLDSMESDRERDRKEIARLTDALNRARIDLDNETLAHIDAENRRQTLEEEIEFLKQIHEQEMKELAALAYRDTTAENREFWKNEMGNALREIQQCYDDKLTSMRGELESYYEMKVQEYKTGATRQNLETTHAKEESKRLRAQLSDLRAKLAELESQNMQLEKAFKLARDEWEEKERNLESENTELKSEVAKLRAEMECILKELQDLMDTKLGLELEIAAYRKLLEGEENRIGLRRVVETMMTSESSESHMMMGSDAVQSTRTEGSSSSGQMTMKLKFEKSAKGAVSIDECAPNGQYITLANSARQEEALKGWRIKRIIDGNERDDIVLPDSTAIRAGGKIKLWAGQKGAGASSNDVVFDTISSFGIGANITTKLVNPHNEDRATHVQKTIYTSGN